MNWEMILVAVISFVVTAVAGKFLIPVLRRLKFGQTILEEGPSWHQAKQGTPTMGGIMFIVGIVAAVVIGYAVMALIHTHGNFQSLVGEGDVAVFVHHNIAGFAEFFQCHADSGLGEAQLVAQVDGVDIALLPAQHIYSFQIILAGFVNLHAKLLV